MRGLLRDEPTVDDVLRDWTILISGVISQQLSNAVPHNNRRSNVRHKR